jgi:hypothetical protein
MLAMNALRVIEQIRKRQREERAHFFQSPVRAYVAETGNEMVGHGERLISKRKPRNCGLRSGQPTGNSRFEYPCDANRLSTREWNYGLRWLEAFGASAFAAYMLAVRGKGPVR